MKRHVKKPVQQNNLFAEYYFATRVAYMEYIMVQNKKT